jgi:hypothetical protein
MGLAVGWSAVVLSFGKKGWRKSLPHSLGEGPPGRRAVGVPVWGCSGQRARGCARAGALVADAPRAPPRPLPASPTPQPCCSSRVCRRRGSGRRLRSTSSGARCVGDREKGPDRGSGPARRWRGRRCRRAAAARAHAAPSTAQQAASHRCATPDAHPPPHPAPAHPPPQRSSTSSASCCACCPSAPAGTCTSSTPTCSGPSTCAPRCGGLGRRGA